MHVPNQSREPQHMSSKPRLFANRGRVQTPPLRCKNQKIQFQLALTGLNVDDNCRTRNENRHQNFFFNTLEYPAMPFNTLIP
jgi:hypothetical protein